MHSKKNMKKKYVSPKLTVHGDAKKLTWGTSGTRADGPKPRSRH